LFFLKPNRRKCLKLFLKSCFHILNLKTLFCFSDSKSKKSVAYNYACILILVVVQSSSDVQMLEQHAASLLKLCKADENNAKLQGIVLEVVLSTCDG
jgi:hypothetical protein